MTCGYFQWLDKMGCIHLEPNLKWMDQEAFEVYEMSNYG